MTTKELEQRISVGIIGTNRYMVRIRYRSRFLNYSCISSDSICYDRIADGREGRNILGITYKQALRKLYDECKRWNKLY